MVTTTLAIVITNHGGYGITPMVLLPWKFFDNNRKDGGFPPGGVPESGANGEGVADLIHVK